MAENPYMLTPEEQLLYAAQDPAHPFIDSRVVSTPIEFALNPQKYGYRNLAEAGVDVLSRAGEQAAPYILYNMSPGGVPMTASRNIAADWQNPYMSGLEKGANTLTNLLGVAMMAAPSQMGQAATSALNTVGRKVGGYADELAPIMKNVAGSEVGGVRLSDEKPRYLHQLGFMPGSKKTNQIPSELTSKSGLIFVRPESSEGLFADMPEYADMVRVELGKQPKLLTVRDRAQLRDITGITGHTDDMEVTRKLASKLKELGYEGYERLDFPEIAILDTIDNRVLGKAWKTKTKQ